MVLPRQGSRDWKSVRITTFSGLIYGKISWILRTSRRTNAYRVNIKETCVLTRNAA